MTLKKGKGCKIAKPSLFINGTTILGNECFIAPFTLFDPQHGIIEIGNNVNINAYTVIYGNVSIGNDCRIAAHVAIIGTDHNFKDAGKTIRSQGIAKKGVLIGSDVWIGSGAKILDGSILGQGCVIGANSVVKGEIEPYSIYAGAIAKRIGNRT